MTGIAKSTATFAKMGRSEVTTVYDATRANHADATANHKRKTTTEG